MDAGVKLYAVDADYRKSRDAPNWYYVKAKTKKEAKERFADKISWLKILKVEEVVDSAQVQEITSQPEKYICF